MITLYIPFLFFQSSFNSSSFNSSFFSFSDSSSSFNSSSFFFLINYINHRPRFVYNLKNNNNNYNSIHYSVLLSKYSTIILIYLFLKEVPLYLYVNFIIRYVVEEEKRRKKERREEWGFFLLLFFFSII